MKTHKGLPRPKNECIKIRAKEIIYELSKDFKSLALNSLLDF